MSLQVWMPLTLDLRNLGISTNKATNSGATFLSSGGKLGGCYKSDGGARFTIPTYSWMTLRPENSFSVALWEKGTATSTTTYIFACTAFELRVLNSTIYVGWGGAANEPARYNATISDSTWYHIAFTWDGPTKTLKLYINGTLQGTSNVTGSVPTSISSNLYCTYNGTRYLNDLRIYNHCLTPQEVKEISKGLVAHYTLGLNSLSEGNNIMTAAFSGWDNSGTSIRNTNDTSYSEVPGGSIVYSVLKDTAGLSAVHIGNVSLTAGHYYRCMCWVYYTGSDTWSNFYVRQVDSRIGSFEYNGTADTRQWPRGKWIPVEVIITPASTANGIYFCDYIQTASSKKAYTGWLVREIGSGLVYDSSGYCRNGTISGTISPSIDTVRYKSCIKFNGSSYASCSSPTAEAKTLSLWAYIGSSIPTYNILFADYKSKLSLGFYDSGTHLITSCSGTQMPVGDTSTVKKNAWNHFVVVNNGSRLLYVNGSPVTMSSNNYWNHSSDLLMIGKTADANDGFTEKISDVRLYATTLSADDVKDLYNLGAQIS